ncbi:MAG: class I adenylate-forming enzyme family protein, partial [Verrucomicrobiota bacterium]
PMKTLADLLRQTAARHPDAVAVSGPGAAGPTRLTYAELREAMEAGARFLRQAGRQPGDRVILPAEPGPAWVAAFFAIQDAQLVAVPVPADTPGDRLQYLARWVGAGAVLPASPPGFPASATRRPTSGEARRTIEVSPPGTRAASPGEAHPGNEPASGMTAVLAFTSGSTDQPRAVELSHANLLANVAALRQVRQAAPGDAFLSLLPPSHLFELTAGLLGPLACGARVVYPGPLLPNRVLAALRTEAITHVLCVPALLESLLQEVLDPLAGPGPRPGPIRGASPMDTLRRWLAEPSSPALTTLRAELPRLLGGRLRSVIVGGAALDPAWWAIAVRLGLPLETGYGLTEAGPVVSLGRLAECPAGSVGRPLPGMEVRLGGHDEILVRGPSVMPRYHGDPAATAAALEDGWLHTGDQGRLDAQGFLFIDGRLKEVLVSAKGETVHPAEMEPHYASPLFREHCVAGVRGPDGNDIPTLFAVPASARIPAEELRRTFE